MKLKTMTALLTAACLALCPVFSAAAANEPGAEIPEQRALAGDVARVDDEYPVETIFPAYPADGITVEELLEFLEIADYGAWIQADMDAENGVAGSRLVCTGMVLNEEAYDNGLSYLVIQGDVVGNGRVGLTQLVRLARAVTGQDPLEGLFEIAGDINENGRIDLSDLVMLAQIYVEATHTEPDITQADLDAAGRQIARDLCQIRYQAGYPLTAISNAAMEAASEYLAMYFLNHEDEQKVHEEWRKIVDRLMPGQYRDAAVAGGGLVEMWSIEEAIDGVLDNDNVLQIVQGSLPAPVQGIGAALYYDESTDIWWYAVVVEIGY